MIPHRDITRDALPAIVRTLDRQPPVARRKPVSFRLRFLLWLVGLLVATAVVAAAIMAIRAIGW